LGWVKLTGVALLLMGLVITQVAEAKTKI